MARTVWAAGGDRGDGGRGARVLVEPESFVVDKENHLEFAPLEKGSNSMKPVTPPPRILSPDRIVGGTSGLSERRALVVPAS